MRLVKAGGQMIATTSESNAQRQAHALQARHGPLSVLPAEWPKRSRRPAAH